MKLSSSMLAVTLLIASGVGALAADKSGEKPKVTKPAKVDNAKKAPAKAEKQPEQVALTGSYIKQNIRRNGLVTSGASPVVVLDSDAIRNSGAADLRDLLVLRGLSR